MHWGSRFKQQSLRQKLILTSIACLVLPTIGMILITSHYSKLIIREHTLDKATQSLTIVQSQINTILGEMVSVANFVHFDPEIKILLEEGKTSPVAARQLTTRLEQVAGETLDLRLTLLDREGRAYSDYSFYEFKPMDFIARDWFDELDRMSSGYETMFLGAEANYLASQKADMPYVFITARALRESSTKPPYAYLIVSRTEAAIRERFETLEEDVFLLNNERTILSNRNVGQIGMNFDSVLPPQEGLSSPDIIHLNEANQLFLTLPLAYGDWRLVSLAPYEQLTGKLNGISRSGLLLQVGFAVCFLLVLAYLLRRFTKPIHTLGKAARQIEAGNLAVRSNIRGEDEVGSLGRSFDHMLDRIQQMMLDYKRQQELKRQAEIAMLQAQLHPHFLFNVLSSIRMRLLLKKDAENAKLLSTLSAMLRASLSRQEEFVTLEQEIETAKQYMELMGFAMRYPTESELSVPPELLTVTVPRLIMQPIIENAYKHGFSKQGGRIVIDISEENRKLMIRVKNNGSGINEARAAELERRMSRVQEAGDSSGPSKSGIGLSNVYTRLKLIYGSDFEMNIQSLDDHWTAVILRFPLHPAGEEGASHV
ncbi:sensor histidine kinase [Paenibacillus daejeonensis]|uniref:sensor histidine kinase n=1 Tax=Paenibacillus daejeonensis TaxID=135193 RepID=UPI0003780729|nr:histidine kinase [Paenibacillus daejeonensis]